LIGVEMKDEKAGGALANPRCTSRRSWWAYALNKPEVVRIEPPLNIPEEYLDRLVEAMGGALGRPVTTGAARLLAHVSEPRKTALHRHLHLGALGTSGQLNFSFVCQSHG